MSSMKLWQVAVVVVAVTMSLVLVGCDGSNAVIAPGGGGGGGGGNGGGGGGGGAQGMYAAYAVGNSWAYRETIGVGQTQNLTFAITGTQNIGGVPCLVLEVSQEGIGVIAHAYGTFSDANGGFLYGVDQGGGLEEMNPPARILPGSAGGNFTTTVNDTFFLSGTYDVQTLSMAASITTPSGTYNNAMQVRMTRQGAGARMGVDTMTFWIVPGVGMVRILCDFGAGDMADVELTAFNPTQ